MRPYLHVILDEFDLRIFVEHDAELIFDAGKLLVRYFNRTARKSVDLIFFQHFFVLLSLFIEEGGLNLLSKIVNQLNVEQSSASVHVLPSPLWMFFCHSCLDLPVWDKRVELTDWSIELSFFFMFLNLQYISDYFLLDWRNYFCRARFAGGWVNFDWGVVFKSIGRIRVLRLKNFNYWNSKIKFTFKVRWLSLIY